MYKSKQLLVLGARLVIVAVVAVTIGCSSMEPYTVENEAEGMKPGPGLLTGENGEKTIFKIPADSKDDQTKENKENKKADDS